MSQTLNINNFNSSNTVQTTRLSVVTPADTSPIDVLNTSGFGVDDYIALGTPGSEGTELCQISAVSSDTALALSANTALDHPAYDYVTRLFGNQIKVYRAADTNGLQPPDSDFSAIATIDLQVDQAYTQYTDTDGSDAYWYKFTYYNSQNATETNLADSKAARGGSYGDYCSIQDIRIEAGFQTAPYVTDAMIDAKRQAAQDEINGTLHGFYTVPFTAPINPFISDICKRLAAGLLLLEQYGQMNAQTTANGDQKVKGARADLNALATKQKVLVDTTGTSMAQAGSTGGVSSWPDGTTDGTNPDGSIDVSALGEGQDAGHAFRRRDVLGYTERQY